MDSDKHYYGIRLSKNALMHYGIPHMRWHHHKYSDDDLRALKEKSGAYSEASKKLAALSRNGSGSSSNNTIHVKNNVPNIQRQKSNSSPSRERYIRGANGQAYLAETPSGGYGRLGTLYRSKISSISNHNDDSNDEDEEYTNSKRKRRINVLNNSKDKFRNLKNKHGR